MCFCFSYRGSAGAKTATRIGGAGREKYATGVCCSAGPHLLSGGGSGGGFFGQFHKLVWMLKLCFHTKSEKKKRGCRIKNTNLISSDSSFILMPSLNYSRNHKWPVIFRRSRTEIPVISTRIYTQFSLSHSDLGGHL